MLVLDQFQIDAVSDIKSNNNVLVVAPTGSGKTLIAEKSIEYYLKKSKNIKSEILICGFYHNFKYNFRSFLMFSFRLSLVINSSIDEN